ncbi:hypothetical protein C2E20_8322 [Micractinium conductrix]|uniref:RRM domain-containing protein n=1 Tax=Micractinium conductrix TaxID=554055 RepID=A0A2P6V1T2_9CHLO|nr:hypothetical protein C2E20_8322 [Micractinium conductrix]|eukprot:PSC68050.1 hypothetical protein C2E20_8322 [Micractinium conductrix]
MLALGVAASGIKGLVLAGPSVVAAPLSAGDTLLLEPSAPGTLMSLPSEGGACAASSAGLLLLGGPQDARLLALRASEQSPAALKLSGCHDGPVEAIAALAERFAVAWGSHVHVLDGQGSELRRLGPLQQPTTAVAWAGASGDVLVAATPAALHLWAAAGEGAAAVLPAPADGVEFLTMAAPFQGGHLLAASCSDREVRCWDVDALLASGGAEAAAAQPLRLCEFEAQATCLAWDSAGQYLAAADGADCAVWDLSDPSGAERSCSMVCCGHEPRTHITVAAFQPDGPLLATASSSGKVALFDCSQFRRGGVVAPAASAQLEDGEVAVTALLWMPDGRLLAGSASGCLAWLFLDAPAAGGEAPPLAGSLVRLSVADAGGGPPPAAAAAAAPASAATPAAADVAAAAVGAGEAGEPLPRTASTSPSLPRSAGSSQQAGPSTPRATTTADGGQDSSAVQYEPALVGQHVQHAQAGSPRVQHAQQEEHKGQAAAPAQGRQGGAGGAASARRSRSGRGGGGRGEPGAAPPAGTPHGFSPALMHHIQSIRDNPPHGARTDQQQLTGWGLGSPSGTHVPWMSTGHGGGAPQGAAVPQGAAGGGPYAAQMAPGGFAAYQNQAMMMQRMQMQSQMHQSAGMQGYAGMAEPRSPAASVGYAGPQAAAAQQQIQMYASGSFGAPGGSFGPQGAPGPTHAVYMQAGGAPTGVMTAQWAPYMQSVQQWAGTAPGYMMYQHAQQYPGAAGAVPQPVRLSGGAAALQQAARSGGVSAQGAYPSMMVPAGSGALSPANSGHLATHWSGGAALSPSGSGSLPPSAFQQAAQRAAPQHAQQREAYRRSESGGSSQRRSSAAADADLATAVADASSNNRACAGGSNGGASRSASGAVAREPPRQPAAPQQRGASDGSSAAAPASSRAEAAEVERQEQGNNDGEGEPAAAAAPRAAAAPSPAAATAAKPAAAQPQPLQQVAAPPPRDASVRQTRLEHAPSSELSSVQNNNNNNNSSPSELGGAELQSLGCDDAGGPPGGPDGISTVYVGNLPSTVDEYMLLCAFAPFGPITHVQVIKEKGSNLSRGYGFVSYAHPVYSTVAMQQMNQQVLFGPFAGQRIKVAPSKRH